MVLYKRYIYVCNLLNVFVREIFTSWSALVKLLPTDFSWD